MASGRRWRRIKTDSRSALAPTPDSGVALTDLGEHFLGGAFAALGRALHVAVEFLARVLACKKQITDGFRDAVGQAGILARLKTGVGGESERGARPMLPKRLFGESICDPRINLFELANE